MNLSTNLHFLKPVGLIIVTLLPAHMWHLLTVSILASHLTFLILHFLELAFMASYLAALELKVTLHL